MPTRRATHSLGLVAILVLSLGGCGGDDGLAVPEETLDTSAPGGTGTVPIPGPADWLEWSPAEAPDPDSEATLVAALEELHMAMVIPASPPPDGRTASATFNSMSLGYGSGQTFPGTTGISLNVCDDTVCFVTVSTPPPDGPCPEGGTRVAVRGDGAACTFQEGGWAEVWWEEQGHSFRAAFADGLALSDGLAWLETWRLLP